MRKMGWDETRLTRLFDCYLTVSYYLNMSLGRSMKVCRCDQKLDLSSNCLDKSTQKRSLHRYILVVG